MQIDQSGYPTHTETGPRCGNHPRADRVRHDSTATIRYCYDLRADQEAQIAAEIAAEQAAERYLEDRGYEEARAQEDWEAAHGVIQFEDAWAIAEAGRF